VCGKALAADTPAHVRAAKDVQADEMILDIGPATARRYSTVIGKAGTIVWNGPVGVFEIDAFANGTRAVADAVAASSAFSIAGGGDTLAAIAKFGITDRIGYISTGAAPSSSSSRARSSRGRGARGKGARLIPLGKPRRDPQAPRSSQRSPRVEHAGSPRAHVRGGVDVGAPQLFPRHGRGPPSPAPELERDAVPQGRPRGRDHGRPAGAPRSASASFKDGRIQLKAGDAFILDATCPSATRARSVSTTRS
jgi:hypothetical protein